MRNAKTLTGAIVTVVETFKGGYSGKSWTRALSSEGHRLVGPSHLFKKGTDGKVRVSPTDLMPEDPQLLPTIENLAKIWCKSPAPIIEKKNPFIRA